MASPTLARKGSSAYEKGIREGRATAMKSRTPEPEEAEEEEEGEEEELDMAMGSPSRKRSAKGAKNTKPAKDGYGMKKPMDAEGCSGGPSCMSKGCKGKCDGSCGKKMDSLTPHEYLAACDLGIQGRSRPYIRARLDAVAARLDLKCGKGAISEGEKCSKGPAQRVNPNTAAKKEFRTLMRDPVAGNNFIRAKANTKGIGNKIKAAGELAARFGGGAAIGLGAMQTFQGAMRGNLGEVSRGYRNMQLGGAAVQVASASKASRMGKKQLSREFLKSAGRNAAIGVGQEAALGGYAGFQRAGGVAGVRRSVRRAYQGTRMRTSGMRSTPSRTGWASSAYDRPLTGRRDSPYAAGFELDTAALEL